MGQTRRSHDDFSEFPAWKIFQLAPIEVLASTNRRNWSRDRSGDISFLVAVWSKICPPCVRSRRVRRSDSDETHAVLSLPVLMKQLQAVRHQGNRLISTVEPSSSMSTVVSAAFNVMRRVPAFRVGL